MAWPSRVRGRTASDRDVPVLRIVAATLGGLALAARDGRVRGIAILTVVISVPALMLTECELAVPVIACGIFPDRRARE
jgi:hypothetical protein